MANIFCYASLDFDKKYQDLVYYVVLWVYGKFDFYTFENW